MQRDVTILNVSLTVSKCMKEKLTELQEEKDADISAVLSLCSVLIDGPYVEELHSSSGLRGSDNQTIWVFRHPEKYKEIETCERSLQMIVRDGNVITIGIP